MFYNATTKDLTDLTAATGLFKNKKRAEYEISFLSAKGGVSNRINRVRFEQSNNIKHWQGGYYKALNNYEQEHKDDFNLVVVEVELKEVIS